MQQGVNASHNIRDNISYPASVSYNVQRAAHFVTQHCPVQASTPIHSEEYPSSNNPVGPFPIYNNTTTQPIAPQPEPPHRPETIILNNGQVQLICDELGASFVKSLMRDHTNMKRQLQKRQEERDRYRQALEQSYHELSLLKHRLENSEQNLLAVSRLFEDERLSRVQIEQELESIQQPQLPPISTLYPKEPTPTQRRQLAPPPAPPIQFFYTHWTMPKPSPSEGNIDSEHGKSKLKNRK